MTETPRRSAWFPICLPSSVILYFLGALFFAFGALYFAAPDWVVGFVDRTLGTSGTAVTAGGPSAPFYGWLVFTAAYMVGAGVSSVLAAREPDHPTAYLIVLLVLKITSSLTALGVALSQRSSQYFPFYWVTFVVDGLLALIILAVLRHLREHARESMRLTENSPSKT